MRDVAQSQIHSVAFAPAVALIGAAGQSSAARGRGALVSPAVRTRHVVPSSARLASAVSLGVLVAALAADPVLAQTRIWNGRASDDWFVSRNWFGGVPTVANDAIINVIFPSEPVVRQPGAFANELIVGHTRSNAPIDIGRLTITSGGTVASNVGTIGNLAGSVGIVRVIGHGSTWTTTDLFVGRGGTATGTLEIAAGADVESVRGFIGRETGAIGTVTVTGGGSTWTNSGDLHVGSFGIGTLTIASGGAVDVAGSLLVGARIGSTGILNIGAAPGAEAVAPGKLTASAIQFGSVSIGIVNFNHTASDYLFAPPISGPGTVSHIGPGTTVLTANNIYSGPTLVGRGILRAGAVNAFSPNSAHIILPAATLDLAGFNQTVPALVNRGRVITNGNADTVLTVAGPYVAGSELLLNTFLGSDGSPSDLLRMDGGRAAGTTDMFITNVGGPGDVTARDGILVVDTVNGGTTRPTAFTLGAPAVAGPFEYTLERGSVTGGNSEAWFLRSALDCVLVPSNPNCIGPRPDPDDPTPDLPATPIPNIRREVSLYVAMPVAASIMGREMIDTLHERMGGNAQVLGPGADGTYGNTPDGIWGRAIGSWATRDGEPGGLFGVSNSFDFSYGALQAGLDLYRREGQGGSHDNAGLYLAYGYGELDVQHHLRGFTVDGGQDDLNAWSLGGYWTHFGPGDWYLDGVVQGTWYDATMDSKRGLGSAETDGWGFAASLEGGYPFHFGGGWLIEPQAQIVYQTLDFDDFSDAGADVGYSDTDSLAGRVGLRLAGSWDLEEAQGADLGAVPPPGELRQASIWLRGDVWDEFLGQPVTNIAAFNRSFPFEADVDGSWWEVGLGGTYDFTAQSTLYANVNYEQSFDGNAHGWEGKVGVKMAW